MRSDRAMEILGKTLAAVVGATLLFVVLCGCVWLVRTAWGWVS